MAKIINTYKGFTATQIINRASSGICTMNSNGSSINCSDIKLTGIKNVIGHYNTNLGSISTSSNVNKYSGFGPIQWTTNNSTFTSTYKTPYTMGNFAGYNHNAVTPFINVVDGATLSFNTNYANTNYSCALDIQFGEINYSLFNYNYYSIVIDNTIVKSEAIPNINGSLQRILFDLTLPAVGVTKTYNLQFWLASDQNHKEAQFVELAKTLSFTVKVSAVFSDFLIVNSTANKDALSSLINTSTEYIYQLSVTSYGRTISTVNNNLSGNYTINALIKRISDNATLRTISVPDHQFRGSFYMSKTNIYNSSSSSSYLVKEDVFLNAGDTSGSLYTIPSQIAPIDGDNFYLTIDNIYE